MTDPRDIRSDGSSYPVLEMFTSMQSEGDRTGTLTHFLRLGGCNFKCSFCFGIKPGRHVPRIITSNCPNKRIDKVAVGDRLMTFDSNLNLVETTVCRLHKREVEKWYEISIGGKMYFVTPEHPFFSTVGIKTAQELNVGDEIYHAGPKDKIHFSKLGDLNPMKRPEIVSKSVAAKDYSAIGVKRSNTIRCQKAEGTYISAWARLDEESKNRIRALHSFRMKGEKNPNWSGGSVTPNFNFLKNLCKSGALTVCKKCQKTKKLEVHHLDGNHSNDSWNNLTTICHSCHSKAHKRGYSFWAKPRRDGRILSVDVDIRAVQRNGYAVESVRCVDINSDEYFPSTRPNPLVVYNLSCEPYNTYFVDYMWVHNCDTPMVPYTMMTPAEIGFALRAMEKQTPTGWNLVITGGEPLIHNLDPLFDELGSPTQENGFFVAMESNGSRLQFLHENNPEMLKRISWLTVSPKAPIPGWLLREYANEVKYIVPDHEDLIDWQHGRVFVQPEFNNAGAVHRCMYWMSKFPNIRMSIQTHKFIGLR